MRAAYKEPRFLFVFAVAVFWLICLGIGWFAGQATFAQEPPPEERRLLFTDPPPPSTCDLEELISLSRAALEKPKDADARKKALDVIDKCDRVFKAWKQNISLAPEQQEP